MRSKVLIKLLTLAFCLPALSFVATAQEPAKRQLVVPLADGGFVAFKSETAWTDTKRVAPELQQVPAVLNSQALADANRIIHRVLKDTGGRFIFGYDLWVAPNPTAKQFKVVVRPLDPQYESKLRAGNASEGEPPQSEPISTFPKSTEPQTLEDGDAFSLDLLVNQNTGIKIVDVVRVAFDRSNIWDNNPRTLPRDFSLDAVELAVKDYRLLVNGNVVSVGKSTKGCAGTLLWFYVPDRGRFIFSLVPREGYEFQKVGIIDDNRIEFTVKGSHYEWLSSAPILPGGGIWNLWVLHDPNYTSMFGSEPPPAKKKDVFEKLDAAVAAANENAARLRNQRQSALSNKRDAVRAQATTERPRVMVGGADRIENLWPKNP
ncbi:MAG TPA: hypothetical protein VHE60_15350 [Pyrinomonadaceae bacterium]|nr:hypothetical protein [Pyrinomonadaceae bacterium]